MPLSTALTPVKRSILVDGSGQVRIADFGVAMIARGGDSVENTTVDRGHTLRWTAPEILNGGVASQEGDIFSFAMVMVEVRHGRPAIATALIQRRFISFQVFTGIVPFNDSSNQAVMVSLMQGKRPERPTYRTFTEKLWLLMQRCWHDAHDSRPSATEVLGTLEVLTCKRLTSPTLTNPERIYLINTIFSDHNWSKVINHVDEDYAQVFLGVVDEVSRQTIPHRAIKRITVARILVSSRLGAG
jgi:serine/threonine protein kinase